MAIEPRKLMAMIGERQGRPSAPLPAAWGVLYAAPNPDGSRKQCANCPMWASSGEQCSIHDPEVEVTADHVCGYHVFGPPMDQHPVHHGMQFVDPGNSGLERIEGGTSCDTCRWYEESVPDSGWCYAVADQESMAPPTSVGRLGCCARWEP